MKKFSKLTTLFMAGALAGLLASSATYAAVEDYTAIVSSVKAQLSVLGVPSDRVGMLTMMQMNELTSILNGSDKDEDKAMNAKFLLDQATSSSAVDMDSPEYMQMVTNLKVKFEAIGVAYPTQKLTAKQVQALMNVFENISNGSNQEDRQKRAIASALASISRPESVTMTNEGVMQMENEISAKISALGLTAPAPGTMTFDQLGALEGIFAQGGTDAFVKQAVLAKLNGN